MKEFIYENTLFKKTVVGFGEDNFYVKEINRRTAVDIIINNHYSGKIYNGSRIHLGLYINKELLGVFQFGCALNSVSMDKVIAGTKFEEYLELNRMWVDDKAGKNTESRAISYCIKYIKKTNPKVKWIQSFADERCGCFGIVYQASNFSYYGEHKSIFWELDGRFYHNIVFTNAKGKGPAYELLHNNLDKIKKHIFRQFRYIYYIDKRVKKNCLLEEKPYEKYYSEDNINYITEGNNNDSIKRS